MRCNLPVTQHEYVYPPGHALVSTTDLQSRITYCNPTFVEVSGFEAEELLGQPHNLIRHPDMPQEAFRDLWETIRSGSPWSAMVKNRRKNGDYYWVLANVTPILENGSPIGYMSVRTRPTRRQVAEAEALYATMRAEAAVGRKLTVLRRGRLQRNSLAGATGRLLSMNTSKYIYTSVCAAAVLTALVSTLVAGGSLTSRSFLIDACVAALLGLVVAAGIRRACFKPLRVLAVLANSVAAGDLTRRVDVNRDDEIGDIQRALNQLNVNLQAIVGDIRRGFETITVASSEIASGNDDLSARTESQASSVQQTAAAVEQISTTVAQSAVAAREVSAISNSATEQTSRSGEVMEGLVLSMGEITESSHQITRIIEVIDSIAFQTNILSLNATVEAARAGQEGRGFAVVAGEVRALAQRTLDASAQVKSIIEESRCKVEDGSKLAAIAGDSLKDTLAAVNSLNRLIVQIGTSADENATGVKQIHTAIGQLDQLTQQNAAMVEELAAAAESLRQQAAAVAASVKIFQLAS